MESRKNSLHRYYYMASELLLLPGFEKEIQGLTDAAQTKLLNGNILQGHPKAFGRIVGCQRLGVGRHLTAEEEIEGVDIHARIQINIGEAEQIVGVGNTVKGIPEKSLIINTLRCLLDLQFQLMGNLLPCVIG